MRSFLASPALTAFATLLTLISIILTVIGLAMANNSLKEGRRQSKVSKQQADQLKVLGDKSRSMLDELATVGTSLTTHRIEASPSIALQLAGLVSKAQTSVRITALYPTRRLFSNPDHWAVLKNALLLRQDEDDFILTLYVASRQSRLRALQLQFADAIDNWPKWSQYEKNSSRLSRFLLSLPDKRSSFDDAHDFINAYLKFQDDTIKDVYWNAEIYETNDYVSVSSWVADNSFAIFALATVTGEPIGFETRDMNMINSFNSIAKRYDAPQTHWRWKKFTDKAVPLIVDPYNSVGDTYDDWKS